jgi:uncharacterized membrane protein (Fun14 family)
MEDNDSLKTKLRELTPEERIVLNKVVGFILKCERRKFLRIQMLSIGVMFALVLLIAYLAWALGPHK